jgi:putative transposase
MIREHVWARKGEIIQGRVSGNRTGRRETLIAALCNNKIIAPFIFRGTTDTITFNYWLSAHLLPNIQGSSSVIVMDNASFHKNPETQLIIEEQGHTLLFLPPYSPHLNPIEHFFGSMKKIFKNTHHIILDDILRMHYCILKFT